MESIAQAAKFEYAGARDWTPGKFASPLDAVKKCTSTCLSSTYSSRNHQPFLSRSQPWVRQRAAGRAT